MGCEVQWRTVRAGAHARVMGYGEKNMTVIHIKKRNGDFQFSLLCNNPKVQRKNRGVCGAKTRKCTPCQAPPTWNKLLDKPRNGRCTLHGGLSTGPKTLAGKEAIRLSNKKRSKH